MAWSESEKTKWFSEQKIQRSYRNDVVSRIEALRGRFDVIQYGALSMNEKAYPVYLLKSKSTASTSGQVNRKTILITGGVHGYETSGVHGALSFLEKVSGQYSEHFDFVCAPCISPWGYETINRWNAKAIDPNRSFRADSPAEESRLFVEALTRFDVKPLAHIDLHETTDTDNTIFRPALDARDGTTSEFSEIPDGFYLVGDTANPQPEFQKAIIDEVRAVTHIAAPDEHGNIIGDPLVQEGVINYDLKK